MGTLSTEAKRIVRDAVSRPGLTALVLAALALGIGLNTSIFSVVHAVLLRSLPYRDPGRIVRVWESRPRVGLDSAAIAAFSMDHFRAWRDANDVFSAMAVYQDQSFNLTGGAEPVRIEGQRVSPVLFPLLGVEPLLGRVFSEDEETPGSERVVILSHALWQRAFGAEENIVGRILHLDGAPYSVVGVMPPEFRFPDPQTELWTPLPAKPIEASPPGAMRIELVPVIAKLAPGVSIEKAEAEGRAFLDHYRGASGGMFGMEGEVEIHLTSLHDQLVRPVRPAILVLFAAVAIVLLIICANLANLFLARGESRGTELAVRAALGASRGRLARELLVESLFYGVTGGVLGILVAHGSLRLLLALASDDYPFLDQARLDGTVLAFNVAVTVLTALLVGLVPAYRASRADVVSGLKGLTGPRPGGGLSRNALAVSEVALALVLFAAAGLLLRSFHALTSLHPGYEPRDVLTFRLSLPATKYADAGARKAFFDALLERLEALSGVESAGLVNVLPLDQERMVTMFGIEGRPPVADRTQMPRASVRIVSPDFFRAMGIRLLSGRGFSESDREGSPQVALVNETLARRYFEGEDPVGKRARPIGEIVGVVSDFRQEGLDTEPEPEMYLSYKQVPAPMGEALSRLGVALRYRPGASGIEDSVESAVRALDPELPLADVRTMEARLERSVARPRLYAVLLSAFALVALVVAASGVYSVVSYQVAERTRENGLRMALGASASDILRGVLSNGFRILLLGLGLGLAGAFFFNRALESVLFRVRPFDPMTLLAVSAVLAGVVLLACALPARRAARMEPMKALRYE
jgi:putative ABC transport system permease protein